MYKYTLVIIISVFNELHKFVHQDELLFLKVVSTKKPFCENLIQNIDSCVCKCVMSYSNIYACKCFL